jgi:hypothetical protein
MSEAINLRRQMPAGKAMAEQLGTPCRSARRYHLSFYCDHDVKRRHGQRPFDACEPHDETH